MSIKLNAVIILLFIFINSLLLAKEPSTSYQDVVVYADAINNPNAKVISVKDIENSNSKTLTEILEKEANISILQVSANSPALVSINGGKGEYITILLNGVKINDPSNIKPFVDIAQIPVSFVEEIEIITGSDVANYGISSISGIINIKTKQSQNNSLEFSQELGNFRTSLTSGGIFLNAYNFNLNIFGNLNKTAGVSSAKFDEQLNKATESDKNNFKNLTINLNYNPSVDHNFQSLYQINNSNVDYDDFSIIGNSLMPIDNIYNNSNSTSELGYLKFNNTFNSIFNSELILSTSNNKRSYYEKIYNYSYHGKNNYLKYQVLIDSNKINTTLGLYFDYNEMKDSFGGFYKDKNISPYISFSEKINDYLKLEQSIITNYSFNGTTNDFIYGYNVGATSKITENIYAKINYGTSYRLPSLYEKYNKTSGNINLLPETSNGINLDAEIYNLHTSFFYAKVENLIQYSSSYNNIGTFQNYGTNISYDFFFKNFSFSPSYAYLMSYSKSNNAFPPLTPKHKGNLAFSYTLKQLSLNLNTLIVGKRFDYTSNSVKTLKAYSLVNTSINYNLSTHLKAYGKINNLFNTDYQPAYGYNSKGTYYALGVNYVFK